MTGEWAQKVGKVGLDSQEARVKCNLWWDLRAGIKATGLCYFFTDLSCCNTLRVSSPCFYGSQILGARVLGEIHRA